MLAANQEGKTKGKRTSRIKGKRTMKMRLKRKRASYASFLTNVSDLGLYVQSLSSCWIRRLKEDHNESLPQNVTVGRAGTHVNWRCAFANNVEPGDTLIFHYRGDGHFVLEVMGKDGVNKYNWSPNCERAALIHRSNETDPDSGGQCMPRRERHAYFVACGLSEALGTTSFAVKMTLNYLTSGVMTIPKQFAQQNFGLVLAKGERVFRIKLWVGVTSWEATMKIYYNGHGVKCSKLYAGWKEFVNWNALALGDNCVFKLFENKREISLCVIVIRKFAGDFWVFE